MKNDYRGPSIVLRVTSDVHILQVSFFAQLASSTGTSTTRSMLERNDKVTSLAAQLVEPNDPRRHTRKDTDDDDEDEALFAELEAEIENDSNSAMREQGLEVLRRE